MVAVVGVLERSAVWEVGGRRLDHFDEAMVFVIDVTPASPGVIGYAAHQTLVDRYADPSKHGVEDDDAAGRVEKLNDVVVSILNTQDPPTCLWNLKPQASPEALPDDKRFFLLQEHSIEADWRHVLALRSSHESVHFTCAVVVQQVIAFAFNLPRYAA